MIFYFIIEDHLNLYLQKNFHRLGFLSPRGAIRIPLRSMLMNALSRYALK
jgi:hypothetical protein